MQQPRDKNGRFVEREVVSSGDKIDFLLSEFEARTISNRLHRLSEILDSDKAPTRVYQDCSWWSKKFREVCMGRENDEEYYEQGEKRHTDAVYPVKVELTPFEAWSLGNRMWDIGEIYEGKTENVSKECKWLARRLHAEADM